MLRRTIVRFSASAKRPAPFCVFKPQAWRGNCGPSGFEVKPTHICHPDSLSVSAHGSSGWTVSVSGGYDATTGFDHGYVQLQSGPDPEAWTARPTEWASL